jgi:anti-sigma B factor antagonist
MRGIFPANYNRKFADFQLLWLKNSQAICVMVGKLRSATVRVLHCFARRNWTRMRGMSPESFRVVSKPPNRPGLQVLQLHGAFTSGASAIFVEAVSSADAPRLILDLTEVPMVDSMAVGALVRAFVSCHKSGRKLALVGLNHRVHNVLHLTGIAPLFDTYSSIGEAEAGLALRDSFSTD